MWVRSGTADDHLRSRFRDATGQTFQIDLGRLEGPLAAGVGAARRSQPRRPGGGATMEYRTRGSPGTP